MSVLLVLMLCGRVVWAHSASDAYLTLTVSAGGGASTRTLTGQWDIALRDLDFVLKLDVDGDGEVTWAETRHRQAEIERYAYRQLKLRDAAGGACIIKPLRLMIDGHADGAYAALFFEATCPKDTTAVALSYSLFFEVDPSHRGIFVFRDGERTSSALFAPHSADITVPLQR